MSGSTAVLSANKVRYGIGNRSVLASCGQSTVLLPPNTDPDVVNFCNQITLWMVIEGDDAVDFQGTTTVPPQPLAAGTGQSWVSAVFPKGFFPQLTGAQDVQAVVNGDRLSPSPWAVSAQPLALGDETFTVLIFYPTADVEAQPHDSIELIVTGISTTGMNATAYPQIGALFYNEVTSKSSSSMIFPQFWMVSKAADPLASPPLSAMPLTAAWTVARFDQSFYQAAFTNRDIGRPDDVAYVMTSAVQTNVMNNLAIELDFGTQGGPLALAGLSGMSFYVGVLAADKLTSAQCPFLTTQNCLVTSSNAGASNQLSVTTDGPDWTTGRGAALGAFFAWKLKPASTQQPLFLDHLTLTIEQLLCKPGATPPAAPYPTAAVLWWTGVPNRSSGCITLPLMGRAPVPATIRLQNTPAGPVSLGETVTMAYTTYAADSGMATVNGNPVGRGGAIALQMPTGTFPIDPAQIFIGNAAFAPVALDLVSGGATYPSPPFQLPLAAPASFDVIISGTLVPDGTSIDTAYTITIPPTVISAEVTTVGTNESTTIAGGQQGSLTAHSVLGGALNITFQAPGGPYFSNNVEAQSWTGNAPPPANTLVIFPYFPNAAYSAPQGGTPTYPAGYYVWQPGYPVRSLNDLLSPGLDAYPPNTTWNGTNPPPFVIGATTVSADGTTTTPVYYPSSASSSALSAFVVTWAPGGPSLALADAVQLVADNALPAKATGLMPVIGAPLTWGGLSFPPPPPNNTQSPFMAACSVPNADPTISTSACMIGNVTVMTSDGWVQAFANITGPLLRVLNTQYTPVPPLQSCQIAVVGGTQAYWQGNVIYSRGKDSPPSFGIDIAYDPVNQYIIVVDIGIGYYNSFMYYMQYDYFSKGISFFQQTACQYPQEWGQNQYCLPSVCGRTTGYLYTIGASHSPSPHGQGGITLSYWYVTPRTAKSIYPNITPVPVLTMPAGDYPIIPAIAVIEPPPGLDLSTFRAGSAS